MRVVLEVQCRVEQLAEPAKAVGLFRDQFRQVAESIDQIALPQRNEMLFRFDPRRARRRLLHGWQIGRHDAKFRMAHKCMRTSALWAESKEVGSCRTAAKRNRRRDNAEGRVLVV